MGITINESTATTIAGIIEETGSFVLKCKDAPPIIVTVSQRPLKAATEEMQLPTNIHIAPIN